MLVIQSLASHTLSGMWVAYVKLEPNDWSTLYTRRGGGGGGGELISSVTNDVGTSVRNLKGNSFIVVKICCHVSRTIFYSEKIIGCIHTNAAINHDMWLPPEYYTDA